MVQVPLEFNETGGYTHQGPRTNCQNPRRDGTWEGNETRNGKPKGKEAEDLKREERVKRRRESFWIGVPAQMRDRERVEM
jgi:hypothetical protein